MSSPIDAGRIVDQMVRERDRGRLDAFLDRYADLDGALIKTRKTSRGGKVVSERVIEMTLPIRWDGLDAIFVLGAASAPNYIEMYPESAPDRRVYTSIANAVWRWLLDRYRKSAARHGVDIDARGVVITASLRPASKPRSKGAVR